MPNPVLQNGVGSPQSIHQTSTTQQHSIGTRGILDERVFRYCRSASASALAPGKLLSIATAVGNHNSVAWASGGAAGDFTVTVTLGNTAATENQYQDGWLAAIDGTGSNQLRRIKYNPAANASATLQLTLYSAIETAFVAADEITLLKNTYADVFQHAGADTLAVAVPCFTIPVGSTTNQYFWAQTRGPAMVWRDGSTFVQGDIVVPADATADTGQVTILAGTTVAAVLNLVKRRHVGVVIDPGDASDNDYTLIQLELE